jgi:hypothetical protein
MSAQVDVVKSIFQMSNPQERIYFDYRVSRLGTAYNVPFLADITGISTEIIDQLLHKLISVNEMLRSCFMVINGDLSRVSYDMVDFDIEFFSVPNLDEVDFRQYLKNFDLKNPPLFRFSIFEDSKHKKYLLFDAHHILFDGYSACLIQKDMENLLLSKDLDERCPYDCYVQHEKSFIRSPEYQKLREYWLRRLDGADFLSPFPVIDENSEGERNNWIKRSIRPEDCEVFKKLALKYKTTQFNFYLSMLYLTVGFETGKKDLIFVTPTLNRSKKIFLQTIGLFINIIPFRNSYNDDNTVSDFLKQVSKNSFADLGNQYFQFNDLVSALRMEHTQNKTPNFSLYFDFEDEFNKKKFTKDLGFDLRRSKYDVDFVIAKRNGFFDIDVSFRPFISANDIENIMERFFNILNLLKYNSTAMEMTIEDFQKSTQE